MPDDFAGFVASYYDRFSAALREVDAEALKRVLGVLDALAEAGGTLWIAGNGGSAGIADHAVCDISKGAYTPGHPPFRAVSLAANGPLLTALGNDLSYDDIYAEPLKFYLRDCDALLVVSSSGNSENVVRALRAAKERGVPTIAFTGFKGGRLAEEADIAVHVAVENYGIVEDLHMSFIHVLTQWMKGRRQVGATA